MFYERLAEKKEQYASRIPLGIFFNDRPNLIYGGIVLYKKIWVTTGFCLYFLYYYFGFFFE